MITIIIIIIVVVVIPNTIKTTLTRCLSTAQPTKANASASSALTTQPLLRWIHYITTLSNQPWYHDAVKDGAVSCGSSVWLKLVLRIYLHINKSRTQESTLLCYQRHHHHQVQSGHHVQCWSVSGCDTSDEWIPNRDEETQGPAEETKGRQPAVLNFSPLFSEMYCVV